MPKGSDLEVLLHRGHRSLIRSRLERGINFRSISPFQAYTNNKGLRYACKAFGLKMSNDALGSAICRKSGSAFH